MSEISSANIEYDNGGAIAIKGFNFQHAIAALIIICNYEKENFNIYLETKDDIEVNYSDNNFFIQAKSGKLTLNELVKKDKNNKSILSKSFSKTSSQKNNYYKIATIEFSQQEQKKLNKKISQHLFNNNEIYEINDETKKNIVSSLIMQGFEEKSLNEKLNNCFIYFAPFTNNSENSYSYLLGVMNQCKINVDGGRGKLILNELLTLIQQKAEKIINNDNERECKNLDSKCLKGLIKTEQYLTVKNTLVQKLEDKNIINIQTSIQLKEFLLSVGIKHLSLKNKIRAYIGDIDIKSDFVETIKNLWETVSVVFTEEKRNLLLAIIIDLYIDELIYNQKDF